MGKDRIVFAEFELDRAHRKLYRGGESVQLYAKTFDLLDFLIDNNGKVVAKGEILDKVWSEQFVEEANLSVQVSALRKALGENKDAPRFLVTVPGVGYKFVADIENGGDRAPNGQLETRSSKPGAQSFKSGRRTAMVIAIVMLTTIIAAVAGYRYYSDVPRKTVRSLAVLPFSAENGDPTFAYLSDGLAENVIHSLSGSPDLRVISRNSAFRFRGKEADSRQIGRELNVDAVLTGRIVTLGDNLSVRTELISTEDDSVIWGEQFTRKVADIERLQNDVARSISERLKLRLSTGPTGSDERLAADAEVYRLTLLGRFSLNQLTDESFRKGRDHFQQAIEKDPNYAPAYAGLAEAYNRLSGYNALSPHDGYPKAKAAAVKAIELDDQLAEPHATLGMIRYFYDWNWPAAEDEFRRALEINPNNAEAHQLYSYFLSSLGRFDESLSEMQRARELDPLSLERNVGVGEIHYLRRDYDQAIAIYRKALETDPNSGFLHWAIGTAYVQKGMYNEAIASYQRSIPLSGDSPDEPASLAYAFALAGRKQEARRILDDLRQRSNERYVPVTQLAVIHAGLGNNDEAFEWLERAFERREMLLALLKVEPIFDRLRDDHRFSDLMRRVGLPK